LDQQDSQDIEQNFSELHEERLSIVVEHLLAAGSRRVLDLGCGSGILLERLVHLPQFEKLMGLDSCRQALTEARSMLQSWMKDENSKVSVHLGSFDQPHEAFKDCDAAVLLETIEHVHPGRLSAVERVIFDDYKPETVIITTPNSDYNVLYNLRPGRYRHPGHQFEWGQVKFKKWAGGVADRNKYAVSFTEAGDFVPAYGSPTQIAVFRKN